MAQERSTTVSQLEGLIARFKNSQYSDSDIVEQMFSACLNLKMSFSIASPFSFGTEFTPTKQEKKTAPFNFGRPDLSSSDDSSSLSDSESEEDRPTPTKRIAKKPTAKKRSTAFGGGGSEESNSSSSGSDSEEEEVRRSPRPLKKKKDPNAPKRPMTPYLLFCGVKRVSYKEEHPEAKITDIARALGEIWKGLPDSEKAVYQEKAQQDKARYEEEMRQYQAKQQDDAPVAKSKGPQPKVKKEENASPAKKPLSAYMIFAREKRDEVKANHPEMGFGELVKEMAVMWKAMNDSDKQVWVDKAQADMDRYKRELNN